MEPSDRRQHARVPLGGSLVGRASVMTDFRVMALAEAGACLETRLPLALDSTCDLSLSLGEANLDLKGRVAKVARKAGGEDAPFVVDVEFVALDPADQAILRFFLDREPKAFLG